ncbi:MAG TPA: hypothetical protein VGE52_00295, partial [Pirellulales bacterium]
SIAGGRSLGVLRDVQQSLAPEGWRLASRPEIEAAGWAAHIAGPVDMLVIALIDHFPGFINTGLLSGEA